MIKLAALFARPLLSKFRLPDTAKDKIATVNTFLAGGSGDEWVPLARQDATLPIVNQIKARSITCGRGSRDHEDRAVRWIQFDWPEQQVDDCTFHKSRWRVYQNGLICLELVASKDATGVDMRDLVGHRLELRDNSGFLIGIWSAAFSIQRRTERVVFSAAAIDKFLPLVLHFDNIDDVQDGSAYRI
ncbi:hypothetical protein [Aurantimonas endophytica]|uniref:Uncharacterized protein n=1 Tax=Aurantimonas endophytica TaxID=1522175 RepID=A0A7W6MS51_9HYPH|nr:hypothetical protein [Aurantimonas endophytica]MBB4005659.1 hypothetical protein [Aurantimonas endophytica]MCO6406391.1 hypothetical protein [Aurantimonas endophytica]